MPGTSTAEFEALLQDLLLDCEPTWDSADASPYLEWCQAFYAGKSAGSFRGRPVEGLRICARLLDRLEATVPGALRFVGALATLRHPEGCQDPRDYLRSAMQQFFKIAGNASVLCHWTMSVMVRVLVAQAPSRSRPSLWAAAGRRLKGFPLVELLAQERRLARAPGAFNPAWSGGHVWTLLHQMRTYPERALTRGCFQAYKILLPTRLRAFEAMPAAERVRLAAWARLVRRLTGERKAPVFKRRRVDPPALEEAAGDDKVAELLRSTQLLRQAAVVAEQRRAELEEEVTPEEEQDEEASPSPAF